jgi:ubiquinone/menaquinone biosynthesis C-methylase UbiE
VRRVIIPELLDTDSGTAEEIAGSLRDLGRINRWFGGNATLASLVQKVAEQTGKNQLSLLDVASGNGEVARQLQSTLKKNGIDIAVTLLDRSPKHLDRSSRAVAGDALALPFQDSAFDVVASTLFVHHLEPAQVTEFTREGLRVCRAAFLINDLIRHPLHVALVYAGLPLFRSRITWNDAPASVRRAYTVEEMLESVRQANPRRVDLLRHYLFRMGVIAWN